MKKSSISVIFLVSMIALSGIGISYSGFIDVITVYGTIDTATVDLTIDDYSGTWVWKVFADDDEMVISNDPTYSVPPDEGFLVAYAKGRDPDYDGIGKDDPLNSDGDPYDAVLEFDNLFPCIDFMADIVFHYEGSIPCKVTDIDWDWIGDSVTMPDGTVIPDFIEWLMINGYMTGGFYRCNEFGELYEPWQEVVVGTQLHYCDYFKLIVTIHLPQLNWLQDLSGAGWVNIGVLQWNDLCDVGEADLSVIKTVDEPNPLVGDSITYTITATNNGPDEAKDVIVEDLLPPDVTYDSHSASKGTYDPVTGIWDIGTMGPGESETLTITVIVDDVGTFGAKTQLAMVLDGSGSIIPADWTIMLDGLAAAVEDSTIFPHDGTCELTVIQFANYHANIEIPATIITAANAVATANSIRAIIQRGGWTPLACGIYLAADTLVASPLNPANGGDYYRQIVNIVTDGVPNVNSYYPTGDPYSGDYVDEGPGKVAAEDAIDYMVATLNMVAGEDEIDAEAVGAFATPDWLRENIVWPGQYWWPPVGPGWVRNITSYREFADTICEKMSVIFAITNRAIIIETYTNDPNSANDIATATVHPIPPE
jgi:uncharacterized repeat protein (TIGR01451 family)